MATAEQIKSLIRSHLSMNAEQFYTSALQLAAHEARQGHTGLANDIREMVDRARKKPALNNVIAFPQALAGLILTEQPARLNAVYGGLYIPLVGSTLEWCNVEKELNVAGN